MPHKKWCGQPCADCKAPCGLDERMPCSPDCKNLNLDGTHNPFKCVAAGCDAYEKFFIELGRFPQTEKGKELPIEWQIMKLEGSRALLVSRYCLDVLPYDQNYNDVGYDRSSLRAWLNGKFYCNSFTLKEKQAICESIVSTETKTVTGGFTVQNKIFLLNTDEAASLFPDEVLRRCSPTSYVLEKGIDMACEHRTKDGQFACPWWLRTPGTNEEAKTIVCVSDNGTFDWDGMDIDTVDYAAVRPAMWVDVNAEAFKEEDRVVKQPVREHRREVNIECRATDPGGCDTFIFRARVLREPLDYIEDAVSAAAMDYIHTEEGFAKYTAKDHHLDWYDFWENVSNDICRKHGFELVKSIPECDRTVFAEENLVDFDKLVFNITDIAWETDGADPADCGLPSRVQVPFKDLADGNELGDMDLDDFKDLVVDWLSDRYGFLIKSLTIE